MSHTIARMIARHIEYLMDNANGRGRMFNWHAEYNEGYRPRRARFREREERYVRYVWDRYGMAPSTVWYLVEVGRL